MAKEITLKVTVDLEELKQALGLEAPTRKRRTKEEIEAEKETKVAPGKEISKKAKTRRGPKAKSQVEEEVEEIEEIEETETEEEVEDFDFEDDSEEVEVPTEDDVREALKAFVKKHKNLASGRAKAKALLLKFKAKSVAELDEEDYINVIEASK